MFAGGEDSDGVGMMEGVGGGDVDGCYVGVRAQRVDGGVC